MALPDINLDDRSFEQLIGFMRKQIDTNQWVDHNASDPGIMLLELLCWVAETISYRANRVPAAHLEKFAKLILDPPEPVTVPLTLTASLSREQSQDLIVKAGTRFATDFKSDDEADGKGKRQPRRYVFETLAPVTFRGPANLKYLTPPPREQSVSVTARELLMVNAQVLGTSDGAANQLFPLKPVLSSLGLPAGSVTRVLVDFAHTSGTYDPNPQVTVAGEPWEIRQFLLTDESRVTDTNKARHFMVDAEEQRIRFGDGVFGARPPAGQEIRCSYRLLQGPAALVEANAVVRRLDPVDGLREDEEIRVANGDAEGAGFFFSSEERIQAGIEAFRRPRRLITAADFETVLLNDFNDFQRRARRSIKVHRAAALMNYKPQAINPISRDSVTIIVLAAAEEIRLDLDRALSNIDLPIEQRQQLIALGPELADSIERFLDRRRLITTRTFVLAPELAPVSVSARVTVAPDRNVPDMVESIKTGIGAFLGVTGGGFDRNGWPLGGYVYRSKLFRLIEDLDGVDFVSSLTLGPADVNGDVPLGPLSLPALTALSVIVTRKD
ncbi:hypothetical protein V5279_18930 [Bradyrhizobium sp. 26S5]|uniref:hypothetical protein n=1 Tax=Bradyrhizobium sp. 26S5 TaxID=3139729 RepID=UPI0030D4FD3A